MKKWLALASILCSSTALAQSETQNPLPGNVIVAPVTEIDFTELEVNVPVNRPDLKLIEVRGDATFAPMIRLRLNFDTEMARSLNEIR